MKKSIKKLICLSMALSVAIPANSNISSAAVEKKQTVSIDKKNNKSDYIIKYRKHYDLKKGKKVYKKNRNVNHKPKDERYLEESDAISISLSNKEVVAIKKENDCVIERDYSVKGLGLDNSSMLTEVPVSFEDYMNQEQEEYSDDPSKFKPLSKDEKIDNDEEILPWNIECVAGDPRNNEYSGKNVKVAVIDSGIDVHNDLNTKKWIDFSDTVKGYKPVDNNGHGTQMAGVISAQKNDWNIIRCGCIFGKDIGQR